VIVAGKNGAGKSSVLDAIAAALGGAEQAPADPVRVGKRKAPIVVNLGDLVVERTFSNGSNPKLVVRNAAMEKQKSPQGLLDALCAQLTFDPLAFAAMRPEKQDAVLKGMAGLDFTELDRKRADLYKQRTAVNAEGKRLSAVVDSSARHEDVPGAEVSVAELMGELQRREAQKRQNDEQRAEVGAVQGSVTDVHERIADIRNDICELEHELEAKRAELRNAEAKCADLSLRFERAQQAADALVDPDTDEVRQQIAQADEVNRKVRENQALADHAAQLEQKRAESQQLTDQIQAIDQAKQEAIANAKFPIPGLGFDEAGVTLDGIPFAQASTSQKIRASVAIGAALHPKLRVLLVRSGNDLDEDSLRVLEQMADELDLQVWVERIAGGPGAVVIEDGATQAEELQQTG
jgi:hypothetical protein